MKQKINFISMKEFKINLIQHSGSDLSIVNSAKVSYNSTSKIMTEKDIKLMNYLAKHDHWTPFEQTSLTFEVYCPIFIARQWMKHRTWVFNEVSARYTSLEPVFYIPNTMRGNVSHNKQSSADDADIPEDAVRSVMQETYKKSWVGYTELLEVGLAREIARGVLPVGIMTKFICTTNLRNYYHWYKLRQAEGAQKEIQWFANKSINDIRTAFPFAVDAMEKKGGIK